MANKVARKNGDAMYLSLVFAHFVYTRYNKSSMVETVCLLEILQIYFF